ncbi:phosphate ABC transporter permease PstA [Flavobacterium urumqiense]|uniref:Phosphate transport system permease protein PstA n=1 Tax=Flavobacterium urumqiense TaxID=935224 RepID=A0A1H5WR28_9FLAO|nr:phosphate ABC transporter permease PstA [Flavobacterium urumqiense]SEG01783.1 phosphate transport system permease protein [Flavobacterium urumqiense]
MRKTEENIFKFLMILSTIIISSTLFLILYTIFSRGVGSLSWNMISKIPEGGFYIGKGGGILNAIIGSVYITFGSTLLGLLVSIPIVIYINVYAKKNSLLANITRLSYDILFGIPSIVYGAFGFAIMVYMGLKTSLLAGIITVTLMIIPILVRAIDEVVRVVPEDMSNSVYSLGGTRYETAKILLRQSIPGIITAILLSFGRAIGDAACVLFTAGFTDSIPTSLDQPAATLPLSIFFQLSSPIQEVQNRAYAAATILTIIVLIISIAAKIASKNLSKNII